MPGNLFIRVSMCLLVSGFGCLYCSFTICLLVRGAKEGLHIAFPWNVKTKSEFVLFKLCLFVFFFHQIP